MEGQASYETLIKQYIEQLNKAKLKNVKVGIAKVQRRRKYTLFEFDNGFILLVPEEK